MKFMVTKLLEMKILKKLTIIRLLEINLVKLVKLKWLKSDYWNLL
jgi:hypothetical protein